MPSIKQFTDFVQVTRIQSCLYFLLDQIFICCCHPYIFRMDTFSDNLFVNFMS
jgi:hypothetical protein